MKDFWNFTYSSVIRQIAQSPSVYVCNCTHTLSLKWTKYLTSFQRGSNSFQLLEFKKSGLSESA